MSGFDVQMRSDALMQQNRQFYEGQKHDAMAQTGHAIAQTGQQVAGVIQRMQAMDMEARLRAQELEIERQHHLEKLGTMQQLHQVKMSELQVRAMDLQVKDAELQFNQRKEAMRSQDNAREMSLRYAPQLYASGMYWDEVGGKWGSLKDLPAEEQKERKRRMEEMMRTGVNSEDRLMRAESRRQQESAVRMLKDRYEESLSEEDESAYRAALDQFVKDFGPAPDDMAPKAPKAKASETRKRIQGLDFSDDWLDKAAAILDSDAIDRIVGAAGFKSVAEGREYILQALADPKHEAHFSVIDFLGGEVASKRDR